MSNTYITLQGLHKWYVRIFEHVGWMMLAKRDRVDHKLDHYTMEVEDLIQALERRIEITEERDRRVDMEIMLKNTLFLKSQIANVL